MKHTPIFLLIIFVLLYLSGCTKDTGNDYTQPNSGKSSLEYHKEAISLVKAAGYEPRDILFSPCDDMCYFITQTENKFYLYYIYYEPESEPERILELNDFTVFSWNVSSDNSGVDCISMCVYSNTDETMHLFEYNRAGELKKDICLDDPDAYQIYAFTLWKHPSGMYLLAGRQKLLLIDEQGKISGYIDCPGISFQSGILMSDGNLYISYTDQKQKCQLAEVDCRNKCLKKSFEIPDAGRVLCENSERNIITLDTDYIYCIDTDKREYGNVIKFSNFRGIVSSRITAMRVREDEYCFLSWDQANPWEFLDLVMILPGADEKAAQVDNKSDVKTDASGRRIVTLYDPHDMAYIVIGASIIDGFNEESDDYVLEIDTSQRDVNIRLADNDSPDLVLLLVDTELEKFYHKGYLENLLPYFQESETVPASELADVFFKSYGFDGGLYSVSRYSTFLSLFGLESEVGSKEGWTIDEFLNWIEDHPHLISDMDMTNWEILDFCLRGNMVRYITIDGKACFNDEPFRLMLERIKNMNCNIISCGHLLTEEKKEPEQTLFIYNSLQDTAWLAQMEALYGEKIIRKGFPNDEGNAVSQLFGWGNLCMLQKGTCKEGAFKFLEYMLIDPWYEIQNSGSEPGKRDYYDAQGMLHTVKKILDLDMERAIGEHTINYYEGDNYFRSSHYSITQEQEDRVLKAWEEALPDTYENQVIREIVEEEALAYFAGQKDLDETCKVIQNRVQLFLNERN